jgi:hypothetical protein
MLSFNALILSGLWTLIESLPRTWVAPRDASPGNFDGKVIVWNEWHVGSFVHHVFFASQESRIENKTGNKQFT